MARRKRKRKGTAKYIVIIVLLLIFIAGVIAYSHFGMTKEKADLNDYFSLSKSDQAAVVIDDSVMGAKGLVADGVPYVEYETVASYISSRFYVDTNEKLLLYALPDELLQIGPDQNAYKEEGQDVKMEHPVWIEKDGTAYIAMDFLERYSPITAKFSKDPNRMMIVTKFGEIKTMEAIKEAQIRKLAGVKSPVLKDVKKGEKLTYLDMVDDWYHVRSEDGFIGYIPERYVSELMVETIKSDYEEPEYTHLLEDDKICLAFDNVTNGTANKFLDDRLKGSKAITILAPTWFAVGDTNGKVDSIASKDYVANAHKKGLKVWPTIRDFDSNGINSGEQTLETLSYTSKRKAIIDSVIKQTKEVGADGINVDFEKINADCGQSYVEFIRELSQQCHAQKLVLSVDNYVPKAYNGHYGRKEQGIFADYVVIMGYDEHTYGDSEAGSVASYGFVEDGIEKTIAEVPADRVINAVPFYTRIWDTNSEKNLTFKSYGMAGAADVVKKAGAAAEWDEETHQDYAEWEQNGHTFQVWLENAKSIKDKLDLMSGYDLAGVGAWRLGQETKDVWNLIAEYME